MNKITKGKVIVLVAPSGSGKTTIANRLLKDFDTLTFSVSATTRPPRNDEKDGVNYHFLHPDEFQKRINQDEFIEWEEFYGGKRYGTLRSEVENKLNSGYFILFDVEVKGALNIKQKYGDNCLTIFIKPPSMNVLKARLMRRGTETEETLKQRLERASMEMQLEGKFDKVVVNNDLDVAYNKVYQIVDSYINNQNKFSKRN